MYWTKQNTSQNVKPSYKASQFINISPKTYLQLSRKDSLEFCKSAWITINPEEETLASFDVSALFTNILVPATLQVINSKFLPAPMSPMSARSLQKNSSGFWNSLSSTRSSALIRNSINNYKVPPWVHLLPSHCKCLLRTYWILCYSYISNINQMVVQAYWWYLQYQQERSSKQTSRAPQLHRFTHQIHHRTPKNWWTPFPRYPDQTHSWLHWIHSLQKTNPHIWVLRPQL